MDILLYHAPYTQHPNPRLLYLIIITVLCIDTTLFREIEKFNVATCIVTAKNYCRASARLSTDGGLVISKIPSRREVP